MPSCEAYPKRTFVQIALTSTLSVSDHAKNPFSNRCTRPVGPPTHSILLRHSIGRLNFRTKSSRESEKSAPKTSCDKLCGHREARLTAHAWLCTCLFRVVHKIGSESLVGSTCWDKLNGKTRCVRSWFEPRGNFLTSSKYFIWYVRGLYDPFKLRP